MFCEKCGAQLPDTASFCNKCGNILRKNANTVRTPMTRASNITIDQKRSFSVLKKNDKKSPKNLMRTFLLVALMVIAITVIVIAVVKKKTNIYGIWTDANKTITFTFNKDGNLWISGENNRFGADAFQFTKEKGVLHLQANGFAEIEFDFEYEMVDDALHISIGEQKITLYREKNFNVKGFNSEDTDVIGSDSEDIDVEDSYLEKVGEALENWAEDAVQVDFLYGTWTDNSGAISFIFSKDGELRISGWDDSFPIDTFTSFSEVDNDTLQLKAESNNPLVGGAVVMEIDYKIVGDSMTVIILGEKLELIRTK